MQFYAQNAVPGLIRGQKRKIAKKIFFLAAKNGGYTPGITAGIHFLGVVL